MDNFLANGAPKIIFKDFGSLKSHAKLKYDYGSADEIVHGSGDDKEMKLKLIEA